MNSVWIFRSDVWVVEKLGRFLLRDEKVGLKNWTELERAAFNVRKLAGGIPIDDMMLPGDFPLSQIALPDKGFAPDYFNLSGYKFASARLREVLAQPEGIVQFVPIDLISGGEMVRTQDYKLMRVIAQQKAMDLERSTYTRRTRVDPRTGEQICYASSIDQIVLLKDLRPNSDIFRIAESLVDIMVTDRLAERLLRAGCTGMEFTNPEDPRWGNRIKHFRTVDGVGERRV